MRLLHLGNTELTAQCKVFKDSEGTPSQDDMYSLLVNPLFYAYMMSKQRGARFLF